VPVTAFRDSVARDIWQQVHDRDEYGISRHDFAPQDVVLDIGAHIGSFSALAVERGAGLVVSVEPDEHHFAWLRQNLHGVLGYRTRSLLLAAGGWRGDIPYLAEGARGADCVIDAFGDEGRRSAWLSLRGLVDLAASTTPAGRLRLVKLDCEGAEWPLLLTADASCFERVDAWVGEYHEPACWHGRDNDLLARMGLVGPLTPERLGRLFEGHGYHFTSWPTPNHLGLFRAWKPGRSVWPA
jgi:FkbM family methyltransferase